MRSVEDFEDFIFPFTPDAPTAVIQHAIRESIVRFMTETKCVIDTVQMPLYAKTPDYIIDVPDCRNVLEVRFVRMGKSGMVPDTSWVELIENVDYTVDIRHDGVPSIVLLDPPQENCHKPLGSDISVEYAWSIKRDGCDIPDYVYEQYMSEIKDGALAELYAIPNQDWTNLQYAMTLRANLDEQYKILRSRFRKWGGNSKMRLGVARSRDRWASFWGAR